MAKKTVVDLGAREEEAPHFHLLPDLSDLSVLAEHKQFKAGKVGRRVVLSLTDRDARKVLGIYAALIRTERPGDYQRIQDLLDLAHRAPQNIPNTQVFISPVE